MKNEDIHSRSYGYEKQGAEPASRRYGDEKITAKPAPRSGKKSGSVLRLVLLPFRLLGWLLVSLWRAFQRRPRLKSGHKKRLWAYARRYGLRMTLIGVLLLIGLFVWASAGLPDPDRLTDRTVAQSTKIYDKSGEHLLYEIFADQKRTLVTLDKVPKHLINGVIATEDVKFYEHGGIRPLSILRGFFVGIFTDKRVSGASTLTQQLVKNAILTPERTVTRKIKEAILSVRLEQKYTKDQILQIYFNEIPYGSTNYGVEAAAQSYFGKHVWELNLQESATLAGLPRAPSVYLRDKDALKTRRDVVLRRMYEEGFISKEEKEAAQAEPITLERNLGTITAPHFVLYVRDQLVNQYGEKTVDTGGLRVITTIDWDMQEKAEVVFEKTGTEALVAAGANNAALVAIDPKNGQIRAMIGSKDFADDSIDGQFNVVTLGRRQPGSSFKPVIYAAAFEKGYTPDTVLYDVATNFAVSGKPYAPLNYDLQERGPVTMRQAIQGSLNIPAVKTLYLVGEKTGISFAERLGYTTFKNGGFGLSLVLGGGEVSMIEHAGAYAVFANRGVRFSTTGILKVEDASGDILFEWKQPKGDRVMDTKISDTITNVLSDDASRAYIFGAGGILTLPGRPVAAKTGTTNGYVDAWTAGYTPSLTSVVWAGNTDNTPMKGGFGGSRVAAVIWHDFMKSALDGTPVESFAPLPKNDAEKAVLRGGQGGSITLKIDKVTGKIATSSTPEKFIEERTYLQAHSILHYVDKDNPRGPFPENPASDPQYLIWENAIQHWIQKKKEKNPDWAVVFEDPPTEYDDVHNLELIPTLEVIFPQNGATLTSRELNTDVRVSAPRGVSKVVYKLNQKQVGVVASHPFNLSYMMQDLDSGEHTLSVAVEDDVGNRLEEIVTFTLDVPAAEPSVSWVTGTATLSQEEFPHTLFLNYFKKDDISSITVVAKNQDGQTVPVTEITDLSNTFNDKIPVVWQDAPDKGSWTILATPKFISGEGGNTAELSVNVL